MFYYLSKIAWLFLQPLNMALLLMVAALLALALARRRLAAFTILLAIIIAGASSWTSAGAFLMQSLEHRFSRPTEPPPGLAGIIVLGGGLEGAINAARGGYELNRGGDRIVEAAVLARRFPGVPLVISGGGGSLLSAGEADADSAPRLLAALGVPMEQLVLENRSRNTYENAQFTAELVKPQPNQRWLLVTSAFHMPRSAALFRKAGFEVVPWPVDYRTAGNEGLEFAADNAADSLEVTTLAIREWIGLAAYRITGRIDSVFPAPDK